MALTRSFKELVQRHVAEDPAFGEALLREGIDTMLSGDVDTGKAILRDYIKATIGFEKLGEATDTPPKSLIRMFGPRGNPQARNLFSVIGYLQKQAGHRRSAPDTIGPMRCSSGTSESATPIGSCRDAREHFRPWPAPSRAAERRSRPARRSDRHIARRPAGHARCATGSREPAGRRFRRRRR